MTLPACDRIIELSEKATRSPWMRVGGYLFTANERGPISGLQHGYDAEMSEQDADFITTTRTVAPKIALALNEAVRAIEDAPHTKECNQSLTALGFIATDPPPSCVCWKQAALAKINDLLK